MKRLFALMLAVLLLCGCSVPAQIAETEPTLPPSPYTAADFQYVEGFLTCSAGETVLGIDVSSHQQTVDWQQVAAAGVEFAIIRLGNRGYVSGDISPDAYAEENLAGAKAAGIKVGAYFFSQAVSVEEAVEEAQFALEMLDGMALELPLVYDWEYVDETARTADVDARMLTDCTLAFCRTVEQAGYSPMIYFNTFQATRLLYLQELEQYPWWLAMYDVTAEFPCKADMWQYTNSGSVPGIEGGVDVNLLFAEFGLGAQLFGQME